MNRDVIYQGLLTLISVFEIWLYYQLVYKVLIDKKEINKIQKSVIWISIFVIGILISINRNILFFSRVLFWVMIILMTFLSYLIVRKNILLNIGIVLVYNSLVALLDFFFVFISIVFLKQGFNNRVYLQGISLEKLIIFTCSRIIVSIFILILRESVVKKYILAYRTTILVIGIVFCVMVRQYQLIVTGILLGLREIKVGKNIISLMTTIIVIGMLALLWMKNKIMQKENEFLLYQEKLVQQKYEELQTALEKNRELVHDMKNHYLVIQGYIESEECEKLKDYISELNEEFIKTNTYIYTGIQILDLILGQKQMVAEQEEIRFEVQATPLSQLHIKEREVCSLFGNLLDNAIEACKQIIVGEKKISVRIEQQKKMLFVEIANTFGKKPKRKNGLFLSAKNELDIHGYGLKSVARIVEAYDGDISYEIKENHFIVNISFFNME